jgi:dolichyldiphosphatase
LSSPSSQPLPQSIHPRRWPVSPTSAFFSFDMRPRSAHRSCEAAKPPNLRDPVSWRHQDALFIHKFSSRLALAAPQIAAPRTMPCLFLPSSRPRLPLTLTSPSSCRRPQCRGHLLLPRRRLGVRMAETARVGVAAEGDALHGGDAEPSQEANGWAPVEAALNWAVSASWHGTPR